MKVRGVSVYVSPIYFIVVAFFLILFIWSYVMTNDFIFIQWGVPLALCLLIIPLISSYSMGVQYLKLFPEYEAESKRIRIKNINLGMHGKAVRVEGVVQTIKGKILGRPRYMIFDGSGSIVVFRSKPVEEKIVVGDNVEAVGMVVKKFAFAGNLQVHGINIRKIENLTPLEMDESIGSEKSLKIKKYN
ncbi:MAG: nucleotide-binding protein [Methanocorpusculum sp.]|nr:nucleotide-binding protein [Methanocorpusculum sp.]